MNTLLFVILGTLLTLVVTPAAIMAMQFVRKQVAGLFVLYKQTTNDERPEWFYDQPAIGFEGLTVEWRWLVVPQLFWNQEKDTTPRLKKFGESWSKSTRRWWSPMKLWDALKTALRDRRNPVEYLPQRELIPTNANQGLVFDGTHILIRRSVLGGIVGTVIMGLVVISLIIGAFWVFSNPRIFTSVPTVVAATSRPVITAFVIPTRTIAEATRQAQVSATPTNMATNTAVPLVVLPGQTNMAPSPTSTRAPTAPPSTNNSLIGGLLLILFGLVPGGVIGYFIGFNNGRKEQQ